MPVEPETVARAERAPSETRKAAPEAGASLGSFEPSAREAEEPVAKVIAEATTIPDAGQPVASPIATPDVAIEHGEPAQRFEVAQTPAPRPAEPSTVAVDVRASLNDAGLELVETDPSKAASTQAESEEPLKLGRARAERQQPVEEDLVQIETRK